MRYQKPAPCEHFDIYKNYYKDTCPDMIALKNEDSPDQCEYYWSGGIDADVDPHAPCKVRRTADEDTQTIEMFNGRN